MRGTVVQGRPQVDYQVLGISASVPLLTESDTCLRQVTTLSDEKASEALQWTCSVWLRCVPVIWLEGGRMTAGSYSS